MYKNPLKDPTHLIMVSIDTLMQWLSQATMNDWAIYKRVRANLCICVTQSARMQISILKS